MSEPASTQGQALSTDQIAVASQGGDAAENEHLYRHPPEDAEKEQAAAAEQADNEASGWMSTAGDGRSIGDHPRTQLLLDDELRGIRARWNDIQAEFVDEPRRAVQDADALVADLMQRVAGMFASERDQLESEWAGDEDVSTEDLRTGLRRYRAFFERLLAA
jgi:hypothetical protein